MLKKQWHTLIIGIIDLIGTLWLIGSIMMGSIFWQDADSMIIGMIFMGVVAFFMLFPIVQSIFGIVCFFVLQKPHRKMMIAYTVMQNMSCVITTIAWLIAISIFYEMQNEYTALGIFVVSFFFSFPVNMIKGIISIVFGIKYCKNERNLRQNWQNYSRI